MSSIPHVVIFPFAVQGHINSMLKLAELLCLAGFQVTFVNTEYNHSRLLRFTNVQSRFCRFPGFRFETIIDGLPADHTRSAGFGTFQDMVGLINQLNNVVKPAFRDLLDRMKSDKTRSQISCIIADGILGIAIDVAQELGIPSISFRTISACCTWIYFCIPQLVKNGDIPFKEDEDMDRSIKSVPEMESFLRCRDLPSFCRVKELDNPGLEFVKIETFNSIRANAQILNTFEDIEAPIISHLKSYWPNLYTIGPLHALLKTLRSNSADSSSGVLTDTSNASLWKEDRSCMTWLDLQPLKSVVYVSFGSLTMVSQEQWLELWYGLVNSGQRFLWVRRPNSFLQKEECEIPAELIEATEKRGYIVEWVPQEEILNHPAVGGFLTHSGWNSTLESMVAGIPMVCWPHLADQQINSRYVSEVWKIGMDMKDDCNRSTVEKLVRNLMVDMREELMRSVNKVSDMARKSVNPGGSSYNNFNALVDFIRKS